MSKPKSGHDYYMEHYSDGHPLAATICGIRMNGLFAVELQKAICDAYNAGRKSMQDEADRLRAENAELRGALSELEALYRSEQEPEALDLAYDAPLARKLRKLLGGGGG